MEQQIERTRPMAMHKRVVMQALTRRPADLADVFPGGPFKTADEAIAFLQGCDEEWFVGKELLTEAEYRAKYPI